MYSTKIKTTDYPHLLDQRFEKPEIEISIHKLLSPNIVIIYPGANGTKDGYENKYIRMADMLVENGVGAVIRSPNRYMIGNGSVTCLEVVVENALRHSEDICGSKKPSLYLVGHSAGAWAIDLIASAYPEVKKLLFTSPAPIRRKNETQHGIGDFTGEVHVFIPENDVIPRFEGILFYDLAVSSSKRTVEIVKDCDHEWSGEENLKKFIELPSKCFA